MKYAEIQYYIAFPSFLPTHNQIKQKTAGSVINHNPICQKMTEKWNWIAIRVHFIYCTRGVFILSWINKNMLLYRYIADEYYFLGNVTPCENVYYYLQFILSTVLLRKKAIRSESEYWNAALWPPIDACRNM